MRKTSKTLLLVFICLLSIISCAKKGSITGGEKDEVPPKFIKATPPNYSTNFNTDEIRIYFDEFIKIKDPQKQIIISPPMDPKPSITPLGGASKYIKIKFLDTLLENTTYSINFGESIIDNNEGNPYSFFRYVFSTGNFLDSLKISGNVVDALEKEVDPFVTVSLYELNDTYKDSLIFKEVPRYVTSTSDSISDFSLSNLKKGTYKLIALKDKATNYKYEPKQDKIGFYEEIVTLPKDTAKIYTIHLFKEILDFKASKPKQATKNSFVFGYEGEADSMNIKMLSTVPNTFESRILPDKDKDTLIYWYKPALKVDSLIFEISNTQNYRDTVIARYRDRYKDSLQVRSLIDGNLAYDQNLKLSANTPLERLDKNRMKLIDKDSIAVPFTADLNKQKNEIEIDFKRTEENRYELEVLPEAITDFLGNVNDTVFVNFRTRKRTDYGTIFLKLEGVKEYPVLVQITTEKGELKKEKIAYDAKTVVIENLEPAKYNIRIIIDKNKNGKWDTGNFLKGIQPEQVFYYPEVTDVRANWELKQTFILE